MLAAALALSAGIAYAQDDCGCDSGCLEDSKPKYVALSFDDGPSLKYTPMMLDVLEENGVKASFFLIGVAKNKFEDESHQSSHTLAFCWGKFKVWCRVHGSFIKQKQ